MVSGGLATKSMAKEPATEDKNKTISLAKLRRVSVIQRISNNQTQNVHPGEDSEAPYMSDNMVEDIGGMEKERF